MLLILMTEGACSHYVQRAKLRGAIIKQLHFLYNSPFNLALKDDNLSSALK